VQVRVDIFFGIVTFNAWLAILADHLSTSASEMLHQDNFIIFRQN
jgi:hypothetical protein